MDLKETLYELSDIEYKSFASKLTRTSYQIIGVRIPLLKKIAKQLKNNLICFDNCIYFEEIMIEGLCIGYLNDIDEVIDKLKNFILKIDNWSICDSCCANLKITKKNKEKMWKFLLSLKNSKQEFILRFMIVMMMGYYIEEEYIKEIFKVLDSIDCEFYYTNMAMSWLLTTSLVKCEEETLMYIEQCKLSDFVFNKFISKACDSYKVNSELKSFLRKIKR